MMAIEGIQQKRVKVSSKRQISIPKEFFDKLHFTNAATVEMHNGALVIRPVEDNTVDFSREILKDLIAKGVEGDDLISEFTKIKSALPQALNNLKAAAMEEETISSSSADYLESLFAEDD